MNGTLEKAQDQFIEHTSKLCDSFGLNHFVAQLYSVLYLNGDEPLSLDEITKRLKVSKGNVSVNIRILENWGAATKVWIKGSRKDHYKANPDIEKILFEKIKQAVKKRLYEMSNMIGEFKKTIESGSKYFSNEEKKTAKIYLDKLKKIERIKNMAEKFISIAHTALF